MNPLLQSHTLPPFSAIRPEYIEPAIKALIDQVKVVVNQVVERGGKPVGQPGGAHRASSGAFGRPFRRFLT